MMNLSFELLQMRQQGGGAIVNNSSIGGLIGIYQARSRRVLWPHEERRA